jgi:hypothetical protein
VLRLSFTFIKAAGDAGLARDNYSTCRSFINSKSKKKAKKEEAVSAPIPWTGTDTRKFQHNSNHHTRPFP